MAEIERMTITLPAEMAAVGNHREAAGVLFDLLSPYEDRVAVAAYGAMLLGAVSRWLGRFSRAGRSTLLT